MPALATESTLWNDLGKEVQVSYVEVFSPTTVSNTTKKTNKKKKINTSVMKPIREPEEIEQQMVEMLTVTQNEASQDDPLGLNQSIWGETARKYGLDPYIIYAIALVESGKAYGDSSEQLVTPWFWTINSNSHLGAFKLATQQEAEQFLEVMTKRGRKSKVGIDIGIMQVNSRWHGNLVNDIKELLVPKINIDIGASILAKTMASTKDPVLGVGYYHSRTPWRAYQYGKTVLVLAELLKKIK